MFTELAEVIRGRYKHERLTVPTLFLLGTGDRAVRTEILRGYEPYCDDLRIELLRGSGHFVCDAEPEVVTERMLDFLREPPAPATTVPTMIGVSR